MKDLISYPKNLFKNDIFLFSISRYFGYGIKIFQSLFIAKLLGPYYFGIWGFLGLVQRYLLYSSLGVPNAVTVQLATEGVFSPNRERQITGSAFSFLIVVSLVLLISGMGFGQYQTGFAERFRFHQFAVLVSAIIALGHLNQLYANIYRVHKRLNRIIFGEQVYNILPLVAIFLFRGEVLLVALLVTLMTSRAIAVVVYIVKPPFPISFSFDFGQVRQLLYIGVPLLLQNFSFYLITLAPHTMISIYYSIEKMGYYSLANTITNSTLLGINTVAWVVFPTILSKTCNNVPDEEVSATVRKINDLYSTSVFLFVYGVILAMPILFLLLPDYKPASSVLYILLLSQAIISVSFGYNCVAISRKKQMKVAQISIIAVVIVAALAFMVAILKFDYSWIAVSVLFGTLIYSVLQGRLGSSLLNDGKVQPGYFKSMLPYGSLCAVLISLASGLLGYTTFGALVGFSIFSIANRDKLAYLVNFLVKRLARS